MRNINLFLSLVLILLGVVVVGLLYGMFQPSEEALAEQRISICGNSSLSKSYTSALNNDSVNVSIGKVLFSNLCASCHNRNMKDHMTGPALSGSVKRFKNDTMAYANYLRNRRQYLVSGNDARLVEVYNEFEKQEKPNYEMLTFNEVKSIIVYIDDRY